MGHKTKMTSKLLSAVWLIVLAGCGGPETINIFASWPDGKIEALHYEVITYNPTVNKASNVITITKSDRDSTLIVSQHLRINNELLLINTSEKYGTYDLNLLNSENTFIFKNQLSAFYGVDSMKITARPDGDKLEIVSSDTIKSSTTIPINDELVTGIGATIRSRILNFEIGRTNEYNQVNLINLGGKEFTVEPIRDSVASLENVTLQFGSFECYKVHKLMPDIVGYTYYTNDSSHIPVMVEAFDRDTGRRIMSILLTGLEYR